MTFRDSQNIKDKAVKLLRDSKESIKSNFGNETNVDVNTTVPTNMTLKLTKLFKTYALYNISDKSVKKAHQRVSKVLMHYPDVLAVEYLQEERIYGASAMLKEMQKHKSKVRKQVAEWDP